MGLVKFVGNAWNQKNLDYEIETGNAMISAPASDVWLETKRTSITRLKRWISNDTLLATETWNQKNLDYEIETVLLDFAV